MAAIIRRLPAEIKTRDAVVGSNARVTSEVDGKHGAGDSRTISRMIDVIARLIAIVLCMAAAFAGVLWVSLELVDAVSTTGESAWYTTLGLAIAAVAVAVFVTARSRTRATIGVTAAMTVLLVAVVLTYPTESEACTPTSGGQAATTESTGEDLGDGIQVDEEEDASGGSGGSADCE